MLKQTKLIIGITLTTFLGLSAFLEPAQAIRRRSNSFSRTSTDETIIRSQFSLVDTTKEGNLILDLEPENDYLGLFIGAIEDYTEGDGRLTRVKGERDSSGNLLFLGEPDSFGNPTFVYSEDGFNPVKKLFDVGDLEATLVADPYEMNQSAIQYRILEQGTNNPILTSILVSSKIDNISGFDLEQAINCLSYILDKKLLGMTSLYSFKPDGTLGSDSFQGSIFSNGPTKEEEIPDSTATGVPEPSSTAGLLAFGVLGAGALLKRKIKSAKH